MATIAIPGIETDEAAREPRPRRSIDEDRIEVPIGGWPVPAARVSASAPPRAALVRISAQRYNEIADYERLADAVARRSGVRLDRRVDRAEEPARHAPDRSRVDEAGLGRHPLARTTR